MHACVHVFAYACVLSYLVHYLSGSVLSCPADRFYRLCQLTTYVRVHACMRAVAHGGLHECFDGCIYA